MLIATYSFKLVHWWQSYYLGLVFSEYFICLFVLFFVFLVIMTVVIDKILTIKLPIEWWFYLDGDFGYFISTSIWYNCNAQILKTISSNLDDPEDWTVANTFSNTYFIIPGKPFKHRYLTKYFPVILKLGQYLAHVHFLHNLSVRWLLSLKY